MGSARAWGALGVLGALAALWAALGPGPRASASNGVSEAAEHGTEGSPTCEAGQGDCLGTVTGRVGYVHDGDTFALNGLDARVRLWALDAPEMKAAGGPASRAWLMGMVRDDPVTCADTGGRSYDRPVMRCWVGGVDLTAASIAAGHGREWCRFSEGFYGECDRPDGRSRR